MVRWLFISACIQPDIGCVQPCVATRVIHTPAKPVCGRHDVGSVSIQWWHKLCLGLSHHGSGPTGWSHRHCCSALKLTVPLTRSTPRSSSRPFSPLTPPPHDRPFSPPHPTHPPWKAQHPLHRGNAEPTVAAAPAAASQLVLPATAGASCEVRAGLLVGLQRERKPPAERTVKARRKTAGGRWKGGGRMAEGEGPLL